MKHDIVRWAVATLLCATIAFADNKVKVPRRNAVEFEHGILNETDEITYTATDDGRGVLHIGTTDQGTIIVSDPVAIHVTQSREMNPEEWILEFGGDVVPGDNRSVVFFDGSQSFLQPTNRYAYIRAADPELKISGVTYDKHREQGDISHSIKGNVVTITGHGWRQPAEAMAASVKLIASNFVVRCYSTERTEEVVDWTKSSLTWIDQHGEIQAGELRTWIKDTYDPVTAPHWSRFAATEPVRLAGQPVLTDGAGVIRWQWLQQPSEPGAGYGLIVNGFPVMTVTPGTGGAAGSLDAFRIAHVEFGEFVSTFYVTAGYWGLPTLLESPTLSLDAPPLWQVTANQTLLLVGEQGVVDYNGVLCHVIEIPTPPGNQMYYRVSAPGSGGRTSINFDHADIKLHGQPIEERLQGALCWPTETLEYSDYANRMVTISLRPDVSIYRLDVDEAASVSFAPGGYPCGAGVMRFETWFTGNIGDIITMGLPLGMQWIGDDDVSFTSDGETIQIRWQVFIRDGQSEWQAEVYGRVP